MSDHAFHLEVITERDSGGYTLWLVCSCDDDWQFDPDRNLGLDHLIGIARKHREEQGGAR